MRVLRLVGRAVLAAMCLILLALAMLAWLVMPDGD